MTIRRFLREFFVKFFSVFKKYYPFNLESFPDSLESKKFQDSRKKETKKVSRMEKLESVLFDVISGLKTLDSDEEKLSTFQMELMFPTPGIRKLLQNFVFKNRKYFSYLFLKYNIYIFFDGIEKERKKPCRDFWRFFEMISHLRTMENDEEFHTYPIHRFFMSRISKRLRELHIKNIRDLLDFPYMDYKIFLFSEEELREFNCGVWNLFCHFSNKQHCKKAMTIYGHPSKSIPLDELIPLVKKDFLAKDLLTLESILMDMVSRLKKMENENEFLNLLIEEFFSRSISRLLKESGIKNMKDLVDFDNIYNLILPFPQKERQRFEIEFSRLYSCFSLFEAIKNRKL